MPLLLENPISPNNLKISNSLIESLGTDYEDLIYKAIRYYKQADKNEFYIVKNKLNEMLINLEQLNNEITNKTSILDNSKQNLNVVFNNLRLKNVNWNTEFDLLLEGRQSSSQLIDDFKKKYYLQYTSNWSIVLGIGIVTYLGYYIYNNRSNIPNK